LDTTYQFRVGVNHSLDTLSGERLLAEAPLDVVQNLCVGCVGFVQYISELEVRGTQTIAEVLSEYPATIYENSKISVYDTNKCCSGTCKHK